MNAKFFIGCSASGGVTGYREGILKGKGGTTKYFETREAASEEAAKLNKEMNGPYATATFRYWVEESESIDFEKETKQ